MTLMFANDLLLKIETQDRFMILPIVKPLTRLQSNIFTSERGGS